ncbi:hypothetical protein H4W80_006597 [Nonomuraea angiospora]|uniref:Uncharacterized protein n=1 Tax=Nonomuraea angiospora TaxID=46172 RepID=A0ABR9M620_9ACTN|nr:hypothetical protein [Nonomuraea angiospora]
MGLGDEPVPELIIEGEWTPRRQQNLGVLVAQTADGQLRQLDEVLQHRHTQLVQRGVRKFLLELRPGRPDHPEPGRRMSGVFQQGTLADARLAFQHQRAALSRTSSAGQFVDALL